MRRHHRHAAHRYVGAVALVALVGSCTQVIDLPSRHTAPNVTCADGVCGCESGFGDCDKTLANGCETELATSQDNCGACGNQCQNGACMAGACVCSVGFADCDGNPMNGCEVDLQTDGKSCGACGHDCLGGMCNAGVCQPVLVASDGDYGISGGFVRVGDTLYMADVVYPAGGGQNSRFVKMPVAGGPIALVQDLADRNVYFMQGDDKGLAAVTDQGAVTYDFATSSLATVDPQAFDPSSEIVVLGSDLFYTIANTYDLYRLPRAGGTSPTFVSSDIQQLAADIELRTWNGAVYFLPANNGVNTIDATGAVVPFGPAVGKDVGGFFGDDTYFYLAFTPGTVERHDIATGAVDMIPTVPSQFSNLPYGANAGPVAVWREDANLLLWEGTTKRTLASNVMPLGDVVPVVLPDQVLYFQDDGVYRIAR